MAALDRTRRLAPAPLWLLALALGAAAAGEPAPPLEAIEDLSESLANDMLDLSVALRDRDLARVSRYFAPSLSSPPFPTAPGPSRMQMKWIGQHGWAAPAGVRAGPSSVSRDTFLRDIAAFLEHFSEIEDVRVKVKAASFAASARPVAGAAEPTGAPGSCGDATLGFSVWGRDRTGRREWARGTVRVRSAVPEQGPWQLTAFEVTALESQTAEVDLFTQVAASAGVARRQPPYGEPGNTGFAWQGAAAGDWNGDGRLDLFVAGAHQNRLYLGLAAGFEDASASTGVATTRAAVAPLGLDYDNDGDLDVFLTAVGEQVLLENRLVPDGRLVFDDVSLERGVALPAVGFSATAADINGDGRPDVYVCSYNRYGQVTPDRWHRATNGTPNLLFVSQAGGGYREEARRWGVDDRRWSYAAQFADVDENGQLDLYVVNDFGENALYVRRGERFVDEARERGALDPGNGMGVSFGDFDRDGRLDLHVTNMSSTAGNRILGRLPRSGTPEDGVLRKLAAGNSLLRNEGAGRFRDVTAEVGPFAGGWAWGGGFLDFDNDGWDDLFTPNGFISGKSMKDT